MAHGIEQRPDDVKGEFRAMIGQKLSPDEMVGKLNVNTFAEDFRGQEHSIVVPETAVDYSFSCKETDRLSDGE